MKELNWVNGVEWGEIYCPMLGREVMTYRGEGIPAYDTFTNPFVEEDGSIIYYKFDQDEGRWDDCSNHLGEYEEDVRCWLGY